VVIDQRLAKRYWPGQNPVGQHISFECGNNKAPGNCSAFIATGSFTKDGKIVIGHNNWTEYIWGQHWNVIADIVPAKGNHMMMDCMPGYIHSGDDFVITGNGLLITETTITQFKGFDSTAIPEFVRARKAAVSQPAVPPPTISMLRIPPMICLFWLWPVAPEAVFRSGLQKNDSAV